MSQHTPGPWVLHIGDGTIRGPVGEIARMRASCVTYTWEADARLIAAAPELLAALMLIDETAGGGDLLAHHQAMNLGRTAIRKATVVPEPEARHPEPRRVDAGPWGAA